jgi:hypothetical protein
MIAATMGWIGTLGTMGAYVMLSRGRWHAGSLRYGVLNLAGGLLGAAGSAAYGAWPSVASNVVWAAVALQSVVVTLRTRRVAPLALAPQPDPEPVLAADATEDAWPDTLQMPAILRAA